MGLPGLAAPGNPKHSLSVKMSYQFREHTADIAFEAFGRDLPELFTSAANAVLATLVYNPGSVRPRERRIVRLENADLEYLLYDFLEELIYLKDTEGLLLKIDRIEIEEAADEAESTGDRAYSDAAEDRIEERDRAFGASGGDPGDSDYWRLVAELTGEVLDATVHEQRADIKAVTFHRFQLERLESGWQCYVILDV